MKDDMKAMRVFVATAAILLPLLPTIGAAATIDFFEGSGASSGFSATASGWQFFSGQSIGDDYEFDGTLAYLGVSGGISQSGEAFAVLADPDHPGLVSEWLHIHFETIPPPFDPITPAGPAGTPGLVHLWGALIAPNDGTWFGAVPPGVETNPSGEFQTTSYPYSVAQKSGQPIDLTTYLIWYGAPPPAMSLAVTFHPAAVPLPSAVWLFGSALAAIAIIGRRKGVSAVTS